jgi:hypothetical protein
VGRGAGGGECTSGADALDQGQFAQMFAHGEAKDTVVEGQTVAKSGANIGRSESGGGPFWQKSYNFPAVWAAFRLHCRRATVKL